MEPVLLPCKPWQAASVAPALHFMRKDGGLELGGVWTNHIPLDQANPFGGRGNWAALHQRAGVTMERDELRAVWKNEDEDYAINPLQYC